MRAFVFGVVMATASAGAHQVTFSPTCSVRGEYSDNLSLTSTEKDYDIVTLFSAGFTLEALDRKSGVSLKYNPEYSYYWRSSETSTLRQYVDFSAWVDILPKTTIEVKNVYIRTEDPSADRPNAREEAEDEDNAEPTDSTIRKGREPYYTNSAGVKFTHGFGEGNSFSGEYTRGFLENEDPDIQDNTEHGAALGLEYFFTRRIGAQVQAVFTKGEIEEAEELKQWTGDVKLTWAITKQLTGFAEYMHSYSDFLGSGVDYNVYQPSTGVQYSLPPDSRIKVAAGYFYTDLEIDGKSSGAAIEIDYKRNMENWSIDLAGSSGYNEAFFGAENLGFNTFYQIDCSARWELTRHLQAHASAGYRDANYGMVDSEREDRIFHAGAGMDWRLLQWLTFRMEYSFNEVDSSDDDREYKENRVVVEVEASPSTPWRLLD